MEGFDQASLIEDQQHKLAKNFLALSVFRNGIGADGPKITARKPTLTQKSMLVRLEDKVPKLVNVLKGSRTRIRSASAGRDRKSDLAARYWGLLFENLRRAVDEIYHTCESDESVDECKEAIMILESCTKDFRNLIEWLRLKWNYEQTPAPQRPTSLAWEVRKSSPSKPSCASFMGHLQKTPVSLARRMLTFEEDPTDADLIIETTKLSESTPVVPAADFQIQTISEANETNAPKPVAVPNPSIAPLSTSATLRKATNRNKLDAAKPSKPTESSAISSTGRTPAVVIKPAWKVGKASKNAVNSEVQSLSQNHKASPQHSAASSTVPSVKASSQQSWAQRLQSTPKFDLSQPQSKSKLNKPAEPVKVVIKQQAVASVRAPTADQTEDGWETVRGRTRSRTSPAKAPQLIRASTVVYASRLEAKQAPIKQGCTSRQQRRSALLKPLTAQSLPSLCDTKVASPVTDLFPIIPTPSPIPTLPFEVTPFSSVAVACEDVAIVVTTDDDEEEKDEAAKVAEEEAEMARREEQLTMEEENLQREIRETERSDNESDEPWEEPINVTPSSTPEGIPLDQSERAIVERDLLEEKYQLLLSNYSWADQMELLDQLQEIAAIDGARQPGRALQVHEKLSSPSRRRLDLSPCLAFEQHEAKQRRAQQYRAALQEEKARKRRDLSKRMEEVRLAKSLLVMQKKMLLDRKMKRAEEKRMKHLEAIIRKAHDEEEKKKEIAFITSLEAQNKRHDFIAHIQTQEERIQGLQEERLRRQEERKLAKEAAVEVRKRALEAERLAKMTLLQEKRRQREERIDREHQEKEKERLELAREKQRDREVRLSALQAAAAASQSQLQRKIQQKQEESARRHEENMELIRQRALELSILRFSSAGGADDAPRIVHYETARRCSLCDVKIHSEVILMSHLRGRKHMEALKNHFGGKEPSIEQSESSNLKFIVDATVSDGSSGPGGAGNGIGASSDSKSGSNGQNVVVESEKEKREKSLKKRAKKLKTKIMQQNETNNIPMAEGSQRHRISRLLQDLERDPSGHERHWAELVRQMEKGGTAEQLVFGGHRGVVTTATVLSSCLLDEQQGRSNSPARVILGAVNTLRLASRSHLVMATHVLHSRAAPVLLEVLAQRLEVLESSGCGVQASGQLCVSVQPMHDAVATAAMNSWVSIVEPISSNPDTIRTNQTLMNRLLNLISYSVSLGLVDRLAFHVGGVRGPLTEEQSASNDLLLSALKFLTSLVDLLHICLNDQRPVKKSKPLPDQTQLVEAFLVTELAGVVNALYGLLLHQGVPSDGAGTTLADNTIRFTMASLQLIHRLALVDLKTFQMIVGAEGVSLEFRHIASFLLLYGVNTPSANHLLNLTILCIGYFATGNHDNQMILQSGHQPSVLQQLCRLPFGYFSDPQLRAVLLPTLLACCHQNPANRAILEKEMSYQMLDDFMNSDDGRSVHLAQTVLDTKALQVMNHNNKHKNG